MRVLVIGAGRTGAQVLRQLQKNPDLTVLTVDPREKPYAVQQGIIAGIDIHEALTPLTLEYVLERTRPDLALLTTTTEDLGLGKAPGMDILAGALREELAAIAEVPVISVARTGGS
ncbi:MAG: hypothetical protein JSV81_12885 [Anaerolineales bacterium]|nr:MAG: hypothetical protein JSV81_12885 [Anaerolineales bacterium]